MESVDLPAMRLASPTPEGLPRTRFPFASAVLRGLARSLCALIVFPVAFVLGVASSLPALVRAALTLVLAALSLAWTGVLLVLHIASVLLYTLGLTHQRKVLLTREGVNRLLKELAADMKDLAVVPRSVARHTTRALQRGNALLNRIVKTSRVRSSELLSTLGKRLQPYALDFQDRYAILEHLPSGGSTARLFVVHALGDGAPRGEKLVLKHFSLDGGSHLENIVRESAAVKLATRLGIVRDSRMTQSSFYYVMPYYEGNTLTREVLALHRSLPEGTAPGPAEQVRFLHWLRDLLEVIVAYHERGVFHKDIKPDNLIASGDKLHLVDIGLLTPFESTLQLTTHGTEYFRDPEMVKLAVRGVAIRDVDCAKFDIYSMGAVLYFLLEGEFPSLGSMSLQRKRTPIALQWIATRAMADFDKRYSSAREMQGDVERLLELAAQQPLADVTVACLPSFRPAAEEPQAMPAPVQVAAVAEAPPPAPAPVPAIAVAAPARSARPAWAWAALIALVLLVGCLLVLRDLGRMSPVAESGTPATAAFLDDPHNRAAIGELFVQVGNELLPVDAPGADAAPSPQPDLADVARSVFQTGRTIREWWQSKHESERTELARRGLLFDAQGVAVPLVLGDEAASHGPWLHADREAAARRIAGLAASFRQALLAALPAGPEGRSERLRLPVLVLPLAGRSRENCEELSKQVKLALAVEGIPFEPAADPELDRLSDELRGLRWPDAVGPGGALEQLLAVRSGGRGEPPCVLRIQPQDDARDGDGGVATVLLLHPRACAERRVTWLARGRDDAEREAE